MDRIPTRVRSHDRHAERMVGLGVVVSGQRHRDDGRVGQGVRSQQRRAQQRDGGERRGAVADESEQQHRPEGRDLLDLGGGERVGDRDDRPPGVRLAGLRGGEMKPPERTVGGGGEAGDLAGGPGDARQRKALGVDDLDRTLLGRGSGHRGRQGEGQRRPGRVQRTRKGAGDDQLDVVELARRGRELLRHKITWSGLRWRAAHPEAGVRRPMSRSSG